MGDSGTPYMDRGCLLFEMATFVIVESCVSTHNGKYVVKCGKCNFNEYNFDVT